MLERDLDSYVRRSVLFKYNQLCLIIKLHSRLFFLALCFVQATTCSFAMFFCVLILACLNTVSKDVSNNSACFISF